MNSKIIILFILSLNLMLVELNPLCSLCQSFVNYLHSLVLNDQTPILLKPLAIKICKFFGFTDFFCTNRIGHIFDFLYEFAPVFSNHTNLCSQINFCVYPKIQYDSESEFTKRILGHNSSSNTSFFIINPILIKPLKVLVFGDAHLNLNYQENKSVICNKSLCCSRDSPDTNISEHQAGKYGHPGCDLPNITYESFIDEIKKNNPDIILWLGDNVPHNMDEQSKETQLDSAKFMVQKLKEVYKGNVYFVLGNHDSFPEGQFDIFDNKHKWLTQGYANLFKEWLTKEAYNEFVENGYYSQKHNGTNLRIICLNTFVSDFSNFYLWGNATNPLNSLYWLEKTLRNSEINNDKVFIIGHIPIQSGSSVYSWSYRYSVLIEKYSHIIKGQFFGHIHTDYFNLMNSIDKNKITGVVHIVPPLTVEPNPAYRIYDVDPNNFDLLDYTQYRLYINEANYKKKSEWKIAYKFRDFYEVPTLSMISHWYIIYRMEFDQAYFAKVYKMYWNEGSNGDKPIDGNWKKMLLCTYKSGNMYEQKDCITKYENIKDYKTYYFPNEYIIPNWSYSIFN